MLCINTGCNIILIKKKENQLNNITLLEIKNNVECTRSIIKVKKIFIKVCGFFYFYLADSVK